MDTLQTLFRAAVAEMFQAFADEMPHSEALLRLAAQPDAPGDATDLFDGWHARRLRTMRLFERQKHLANAIREAGGTPRLHA